MSALATLQSDFLATLAGGADAVGQRLDRGAGLDPARGLAIYVHAYSARLREALENDHATLATLLDDEAWQDLSNAYIAAHPSRHRSLRHFGDALPAYLRAQHPATPLLAELAAFERALLDSFDAADAAPASWESLLALAPTQWPGLRPQFVPALGRLSTRTPAVEAWKAVRAGSPPPLDAAARTDWVIWRDASQVTRFRSLPATEALLLDHFLAGGDFAAACEHLAAVDASQAPAFAVDCLQRWCAEGWIAAWRA